jgi:hypothetical protein
MKFQVTENKSQWLTRDQRSTRSQQSDLPHWHAPMNARIIRILQMRTEGQSATLTSQVKYLFRNPLKNLQKKGTLQGKLKARCKCITSQSKDCTSVKVGNVRSSSSIHRWFIHHNTSFDLKLEALSPGEACIDHLSSVAGLLKLLKLEEVLNSFGSRQKSSKRRWNHQACSTPPGLDTWTNLAHLGSLGTQSDSAISLALLFVFSHPPAETSWSHQLR